MNYIKKILIVLWFVVILFGAFFVGGGCATTNLASFIDPEYKAHTFKKVLILAPFSNLQYRQRMENDLFEGLKLVGIDGIKGSDLFPPTREWTEEEKLVKILENQIDCYLVIQVKDAGYTEQYIPPSTSTDTRGKVSVIGNRASYRESSTTTVSGGHNVLNPWADFEARLLDAENSKTAWLGSASSGGNALADNGTLITSFANTTSSKLAESKLFSIEK